MNTNYILAGLLCLSSGFCGETIQEYVLKRGAPMPIKDVAGVVREQGCVVSLDSDLSVIVSSDKNMMYLSPKLKTRIVVTASHGAVEVIDRNSNGQYDVLDSVYRRNSDNSITVLTGDEAKNYFDVAYSRVRAQLFPPIDPHEAKPHTRS